MFKFISKTNSNVNLFEAIESGDSDSVEKALQQGADVNKKNSDGNLPLCLASANGHKEIVALLLDKGANPDLQNKYGKAPLHCAAQNGHKEIATLLLDKGANPNLKKGDGWAPLLLAAQNGHKEIVTLLLDNGANPDLKNNKGESPLHWASKYGHKEIEKLLSDKEAYSAQRLKRNKIITGREYHPNLTYQEAKFLVEHLAVMSLWRTCKNIYATEYTTGQTSHWLNLPLDIKKTIIGFLVGGERTTEQLSTLYEKITTKWKSDDFKKLSKNNQFEQSKAFILKQLDSYLNRTFTSHHERVEDLRNNGILRTKDCSELAKEMAAAYRRLNGAREESGPQKTLSKISGLFFPANQNKGETQESKNTESDTNNDEKQDIQGKQIAKRYQPVESFDRNGKFFNTYVLCQHQVNCCGQEKPYT